MTKLHSAMTAAALVALIAGPQTAAADGAGLAPGKPSGVKQAQHGGSPRPLVIMGVAVAVVAAVGLAVALSNDTSCSDAACAVTGTTS